METCLTDREKNKEVLHRVNEKREHPAYNTEK